MPKRPRQESRAQVQRSAPDWWGRSIALAALVVAGLSFWVAYGQWLDARATKARQLSVRLFFGAPIAKGKQHPIGLQIKAANPGYQPVTVTSAGVLFPDGSRYGVDRARGEWEFGSTIAPGENKVVLLAGRDLLELCQALRSRGFEGAVALIGYYEDALNELHRSDPLTLDIGEASKLAVSQIEQAGSEGTRRDGR
jgi:hypothetical protein